MYGLARSDDEIDEQLNKAGEADGKTKWPGMSYEQGVDATLRWAIGWSEDAPMDE